MNFALMSDMRLAEVSHFAHHLFHSYQKEEDALMLGILAHSPALPSPDSAAGATCAAC